MFVCIDFFCFKQKPSCEMPISDCSSDVCSSDLGQQVARFLIGSHFDTQAHAECLPRLHLEHLALAGASKARAAIAMGVEKQQRLGILLVIFFAILLGIETRLGHKAEDRKSTRLNSSH